MQYGGARDVNKETKRREKMKKVFVSTIVVLVLLVTAAPSFALVTPYSDRAGWEAAVGGYSDVDLASQVADNALLSVGTNLDLAGVDTLSFDVDLRGRQVSSSWATWSGGNTPRILYTDGLSSVTGFFGSGVNAFGLEAQPNAFVELNITLRLDDQNSLVQVVNGDAGAKFYGFVSDSTIMSFDLFLTPDQDPDTEDDFAFGRIVVESSQVPVPGALWLLGSGFLSLVGLRRKLR